MVLYNSYINSDIILNIVFNSVTAALFQVPNQHMIFTVNKCLKIPYLTYNTLQLYSILHYNIPYNIPTCSSLRS